MTVKEYLDKRPNETYGKKIRVVALTHNRGVSDWTLYADREIFKINVTTKYIFIYVK
jgi:hypothetical protein